MFKRQKPDFTIELERGENDVIYADVSGFFEFRGEVYYRYNGSPARHIYDNMKFSEKIKANYPEEFALITSTGLSLINVRPVYVKKIEEGGKK